MSSTTTFKRRELAHRANNGIEVSLFWEKVGDVLKTDEFFELEIPRDRAMDAFHHPYAYLGAHEAAEVTELLAA